MRIAEMKALTILEELPARVASQDARAEVEAPGSPPPRSEVDQHADSMDREFGSVVIPRFEPEGGQDVGEPRSEECICAEVSVCSGVPSARTVEW